MKIRPSPAPQLNLARSHGGIWPTPEQELLLKAALLQSPDAQKAWQDWQTAEHLDSLDTASWRLLPLAYLNLTRLGIQDPLLDEAKAIHRYHWARNQKLYNRTRTLLDVLHGLDVPTVVLKGAALAELYYRDAGARPMEDLDLLVPAERFLFVAQHLLKNGWRQIEGFNFDYYDMQVHHSFAFARADGLSVDLHAHVLLADCTPGADESFWSRVQSWELKGKPALTLCAEDHFLHAVSHGVRWNPVPPCRWMADAWWILQRTQTDFNWERLVEQARFHRVPLSVFHGLQRMQAIVPLHLPEGLLDSLRAIPSLLKTRIDFACDLTPKPMTLSEILGNVWQELGKDPVSSAWSVKLSELRSYLFEEWNIHSTLLIPFVVVKLLAQHYWDRLKILALSQPRLKNVVESVQTLLLLWRKKLGFLPKRPA